jgi:hypothetical protein
MVIYDGIYIYANKFYFVITLLLNQAGLYIFDFKIHTLESNFLFVCTDVLFHGSYRLLMCILIFPHRSTALFGPGLLIIGVSRLHSARHNTCGRTPLAQWSARNRHLYLKTCNNHKRQTSMPPVRFEPAFPASKWPQSHTLNRVAREIGKCVYYTCSLSNLWIK